MSESRVANGNEASEERPKLLCTTLLIEATMHYTIECGILFLSNYGDSFSFAVICISPLVGLYSFYQETYEQRQSLLSVTHLHKLVIIMSTTTCIYMFSSEYVSNAV